MLSVLLKPVYLFPLSVFFLFAALFSLLPDLRCCDLSTHKNGRVTVPELCVLALICAAYGFTAFHALGDRAAPTGFAAYSPGESTVIELSGEEDPVEVLLYSGLNVGSFSIQLSEDGESYYPAAEFTQKYTSIFKWTSVPLDFSALSSPPRYARIVCTGGSPRLGEAAFRSLDGTLLRPLGTTALTDEQELVPAASDFMNSSYFDEIYHARTAEEHIEGMWPYEVSHPPLGKLILSLGIRLFGLNPFGWRFSGALFGVLMLPVLYFFCRELFDKRVAACCTVIFAFDFMHFTQTRIATIDTYGVFFIILMYWFMYIFVSRDGSGDERHSRLSLALSGVSFGLGAASKWTAIYAGAGLGVIWLAHWLLRLIGSRKDEKKALRVKIQFLENCLFCILFFVCIPALIYYVSYYPYGSASGLHGVGMFFRRDYLDIVLNNQDYMFRYHSELVATHPYSSRWYQWMLDIRPILYYLGRSDTGLTQSIAAFVNPALCWGGLISVFLLAVLAVVRRDRKAAFIVAGYLAQLLPWIFISRLTFAYHYFPCVVFLVIALGYIFDLIRRSERHWRIPVYGFSAFCVILFVIFYPVLSGAPLRAGIAERFLSWLPSWPF